jgi:RNA ligase
MNEPTDVAGGRSHDGLLKYPRTAHVQGSRLQLGDEDLDSVPFVSLAHAFVVVEEKIDGQNAAVSFGVDGTLLLQSRGHYLRGGPREASFAPFKRWANAHHAELFGALGLRYILFGEWCFAKHTIFYDALPHWFLAFDVFDKERGVFIDTAARRLLLRDTSVEEVPVLHMGELSHMDALLAFVGPSTCKTSQWRTAMRQAMTTVAHLDVERAIRDTDDNDAMEGLYLKVERDGVVVERLKWVRASFLQVVQGSNSHWFDRPIVANGLRNSARL